MEHTYTATGKWISRVTLLGAVLVLIAAGLHPVTVSPWNADIPIHFIEKNHAQWMWDHSLMTAAIVLWLGGLAACFGLYQQGRPFHPLVIALLISSIALWLATLALELGGMPISVKYLQASAIHRPLAESLFAGSLIMGYFAMIPAWLAVACGAGTKWGMTSGWIGTIGIVSCLLYPALWILIVSSVFPFLWTIIFAWKHAS